MFGQFKQKLQSLSPLGSPVTSPANSPKFKRRFAIRATPHVTAGVSRRKRALALREEVREVQSEPEYDFEASTDQGRYRNPNKRRTNNNHHHLLYNQNGVHARTLGRARGKKEIHRVSQYEKYLEDLLKETRPDHPDHDDLVKVAAKAKQVWSGPGGDGRETETETDLDRIQDLFPSDTLHLHSKEPSVAKMKGLLKRRGGAGHRLHRVLSSSKGGGESPEPGPGPGPPTREFLMETPVHFTTGVQSQERHLFLFNDLLLVAKSRSGGHFKLKERVRVRELWLTSNALEEVSEVTKNPDTSFVLGWPVTNVVATFNTGATKELWMKKLSQLMDSEKEREPRSLTIQVTFFDHVNNIEYCKTLSVGPRDTALECIKMALDHLEMGGVDPAHFQLWAITGLEDSPYPLIGHEHPFAIKMHVLRETLLSLEPETDFFPHPHPDLNPIARCQFVLRRTRKDSVGSEGKKVKGGMMKGTSIAKSPIRLHKMFRRSLTKLDTVVDGEGGGGGMSPCSGGLLFGQPLGKLCETESVPRPVMDMLSQLFLKGPFTHGIFRKSANARQVRELHDRLDSEPDVELDDVPIFTVAALFKDFLRSLPDCLLGSHLYSDWLRVAHCPSDRDKILHMQALFSKLPKENITLLQHFLCVLYHISQRSGENQMSSGNLAVCVGPSILSPPASSPNPMLALNAQTSKLIPSLVELMIDRCPEIFGSETLKLFGDPPPKDPSRSPDSGAEESDSLHSLQSGHSGGRDGLRRDDSSIDSLEREFLGEEGSPLPRKDKMSLTNLSRDSGLTMSDTQLYTPDEEESESTSSGEKSNYSSSGHGSEKEKDPPYAHHHKLTVSYSSPMYNGEKESGKTSVMNPHFQRQDWTRKRSALRKLQSARPLNGVDVRHSPLRRSASEESLMNVSSGRAVSPKRPALHGKGPAPPPPLISTQHRIVIENSSPSPPMHRSRSVHHVHEEHDEEGAGTCSQGVPHGDEVDSSTLSDDDDSTPHVSRSNSRGKDCGIVVQPLGSGIRPSCEININRTASSSTVKSTDSSSTLTNGSICSGGGVVGTCSRPPSYEEALNRRSTLLHGDQSSLQQSKLSAKAKSLYEESLRLYAESTGDFVYASASRVETHDDASPPPPLPPKQKLRRGSGIKQHVPVHVQHPQQQQLQHQQQDNSSSPCRRPRPYSMNEEMVEAAEPIYAPVPHARRKAVNRAIATPPVERQSVETQTDPELDSGTTWSQTPTGKFVSSVRIESTSPTSVSCPRPGRRATPPARNSSSRSKSLPPQERLVSEESESDMDVHDELPDPTLRKEISWSVSQLRALFGDRQASNLQLSPPYFRNCDGKKEYPPPYRHPPVHRATPHPPKYHFGQNNHHSQDTSNGYGEESYV